MINKGRMRQFRQVVHKDDADWVTYYLTREVDTTRHSSSLRQTWWYSVKDRKGLGLSQENSQPRNKSRGNIKGATGVDWENCHHMCV